MLRSEHTICSEASMPSALKQACHLLRTEHTICSKNKKDMTTNNNKRQLSARLLAAALTICLYGCSGEITDGNTLPAGKYPMTFTAAVDGLMQTRATTDNTWKGGEEIAVQIDDEVKKYVAAMDNTLSVENDGTPWYWQNTTERKTVSAWYPHSITKLADEALTVKADQSGNGYQASDYLEAAETEVSFASSALTFKHRTTKVIVKLNAGNGVSAGDLSGATVRFLNLTGVEGDGTEVTPKFDNNTYSALLIPQQIKGKKFIQVTAGGNTYYYTPAGSDAEFAGSKQYPYEITVTKNGLAVTVGGVTEWGSGSEIEVTSKVLESGFAPSDLKIGDYYYSDGTWSDGGYRKYTDGSTAILPVMPVLTGDGGKERTVIGIVYCTDVSRIGTAATKALQEKGVDSPHGLVMALTNASDGCRWGEYNKDENSGGNDGTPFKDNTSNLQKQYNNVDGYGETQWIINTYGSSGATLQDTYTAFYHASRYGTAASNTEKYAAPANTTGWFIPSMGQWWDILSGLGGIDLSRYQNSTDEYTFIPGAASTAIGNMNKYLQKISGATTFSTDTFFWSSSECNGGGACYVGFGSNGNLLLHYYNKYYGFIRVRCSFAF